MAKSDAYRVVPVTSRAELKRFIKLPYSLYADDPLWVAPLLMEEKKQYSPATNSMLKHCDVQLFLLYRGDEIAGRISAFIDHLAVKHWKEPIGLFGSFECIDDKEAASHLLNAAHEFLKEKGMKIMRGPWSFASQEWGCMIKGFETSPMILAPYNPVYYQDLLESTGLKKAKDLLVYDMEINDESSLPERFLKLTDRVQERYKVTLRPVDMKNLEEDVKTLLFIANEATMNNWGFAPVTEEEAKEIAESVKMILDPDIVMIAEVAGKPVGYLIAFPDINTILKPLKGKLFPFGFVKLLREKKHITQYRIWGLGVLPEYQRKALDTLFYRKLSEVLLSKDPMPTRLEANYVLEDNMVMNNPIMKMGFQVAKKYRVYEKPI